VFKLTDTSPVTVGILSVLIVSALPLLAQTSRDQLDSWRFWEKDISNPYPQPF
jgi:hypothetical protein